MLSRKSGSLTRQLFRRIITLSLLAVLSLLAAGGVGLLSMQVLAQHDLDLSGSSAAHNFDLFMANITYDVKSVGDSLHATDSTRMFRDMLDRHPGIFELSLLNLQGDILEQRRRVGSSDIGGRVSEQPWLETIQAGELYVGKIDSQEYGVPFIDIAAPVDDDTGTITGTLVARFDLTALWNQVINTRVGETGYTYIVDNNGQILVSSEPELAQQQANLKDVVGNSPQDITDGAFLSLFNIYTGIKDKIVVGSAQQLTVVPWYAITEQPHTEALAGFVPFSIILVVALLLLVVLVYSIGRFIRRNVIKPLGEISKGLQIFRSGDLSYEIKASGTLELQDLATTINEIAHELDRSSTELAETNQTLEQRVAERSRDLETVAQVVSQTATILDVKQLLQAVVDLTKTNFNLYHTHVYLLDETETVLELAAGSGQVGKILTEQGHHISAQSARSLVASAARTQSVVVVNNVTAATDFLPNPLLPLTQSELAVALVARGKLLGVLDVQSAEAGHFGPELQAVMRTLAQQIAAALSNARLYGETERISRQEQALSVISQQMQSAVSIEDVLQTAARELGKALHVPHTTIALQLAEGEQEANMQVVHDEH